jgi:hypothetical protein
MAIDSGNIYYREITITIPSSSIEYGIVKSIITVEVDGDRKIAVKDSEDLNSRYLYEQIEEILLSINNLSNKNIINNISQYTIYITTRFPRNPDCNSILIKL